MEIRKVITSKTPTEKTVRYITTESSPSRSTQRVVKEYQTFSTKDFPGLDDSSNFVVTNFSSSSGDDQTDDDSGFKTIVTKKTVTTADGKVMTTTVTKREATSSSLPEEFTRKLCVTRQQLPTTVTVIKKTSEAQIEPTASLPSPSKDPVAKSTEPSTPIKIDDFAKECLAAHNQYRTKHGCPPLTISAELCRYSQEWVTYLAKADKFQHRPGVKYGENIFMKWSSNPDFQISGTSAVESWYSEIKDHVFGQEPRSLKSGHFSQVIWKGSKEMGVAQGRSKTGKIIVVANYNPAGNMIGSFTENVPPPV